MKDRAEIAEDPAAGWSLASLLVVGLCFTINAVDGMNVLLISYLAPAIAGDWKLSSTTLGVVFSAGLVGMAIGGLVIAPLGDRLGRRPLILGSLLAMSIGMILSGFAVDVNQLLAARVVVGTGIGTVLACMTALVAEFAPPRSRSFAVGLLQGGYPVGATITGFATAWALAAHSWHVILLTAGFGSLAFFPLAFVLLPESAQFLKLAQNKRFIEQIERLPIELDAEEVHTLSPAGNSNQGKSFLAKLMSREMLRNTLLLWCAVFFGFLVLYSIVSWIPRLAIRAGLDPRDGIYAGSIYNIGAFCGTVVLAWFAESAGLKPLITSFLLAAAGLLLLFGGVAMPVAGVLLTAFCIGVTLQGGFNGIYPLSTWVYPVDIRSSGLGWAMGVGRAGAVIGPMMSGFILSLHASPIVLFAVLAVALLITSLSVAGIR